MKKLALVFILFAYLAVSTVQGFAEGHSYSGHWGIHSDARVAVDGRVIGLERDPVIIGGRMVVPARTVFQALGVKTDWYPSYEVIEMTKGDASVTMSLGSTVAYVNRTIKYMEAPPVLVNGTVMVPIRFIAETFHSRIGWDGENRVAFIGDKPELVSRGGIRRDKVYKVVIDAGHGGWQSGAAYGGVKEKDLNIDIARRLNSLLKAEGIRTYMTREWDSYVSLYSRSALANRVGADLFVSIHNNAGHSKHSGSMTLYYPGSQKTRGNLTSLEFAQIVQRNMTQYLGTDDKGTIARSNLAVLRTSNMPAVIAEVGYMSNPKELNKLKTHSYRQKAAESLKNAILESLKEMY